MCKGEQEVRPEYINSYTCCNKETVRVEGKVEKTQQESDNPHRECNQESQRRMMQEGD
jgi:hypothetical protein